MPIVKSIHVINLHFWTSLLIGCSYYYLLKVDKVNITPCVYFKVPITSIFLLLLLLSLLLLLFSYLILYFMSRS